jgi:Tfp pilus assembly protein PilV
MGTSITLNNVFEAMGIMLIGTVIAVIIVTLVMLGLYRFFKNDTSEQTTQQPMEIKQSTSDLIPPQQPK